MFQRSRSNTMLGIAFGEKSALLAEVTMSEAGPQLTRAGEFVYPTAGFQDPPALGQTLSGFLKEKRFSTRSAVLGLPAKWVLSKRKDVPAADPQLVIETLRLQAETEFPSELKDLTYDFAGQPSATENGAVLLVAAQKRYIDQVTQTATAAGLRAAAVVPFSAAIGAAGPPFADDAAVLLLGPGGAEFVSRQHGHPRSIRYLGAPPAPAPVLGGDLRRAAAGFSVNGAATNGQAVPGIIVWNDSGVDPSVIERIGEVAGAPLRNGDLGLLGISRGTDSTDGRSFAAAAALALAGLRQATTSIDLLHPKLAAPKKSRIDQRVTIGAAVAALVLIVVAWAGYDVYSQQKDLAKKQADLKLMEPRVSLAKASVGRISFAKDWHGEKPVFLACLRDLTADVPDNGQVYLTRFNLSENVQPQLGGQAASKTLKGNITGRATTDQNAKNLFDKLKTNPRFTEVKLSFDPAEIGKTANPEASFTMTFEYQPEK